MYPFLNQYTVLPLVITKHTFLYFGPNFNFYLSDASTMQAQFESQEAALKAAEHNYTQTWEKVIC